MKSVLVKGLSDIQVENICFDAPIKNKFGSYISNAYIKENNEKKEIYFQTGKIFSLDGIISNEKRSFIEIEFNNKNVNLYDFISSLEEHCIMETHKQSNLWFNQKFPLEVVDDFFKSTIKPARSNKLPSIKFKIPISKKKITAQIYNQKRQLVNYQDVDKNSNVKLVIKFEGLKFLKQQCFCELFVLQIKYYDPNLEKNNSIGYILQDSDNEEDTYNIPKPLPSELDILLNTENQVQETENIIKFQEEKIILQEDSENIIKDTLENNVEEHNIINQQIENIDLNNIENVIQLTREEKEEIQHEISNSNHKDFEENLREKKKEYLTALNEYKMLKTNQKKNIKNNDDLLLYEDAQKALGI